MRTPTTSLTRMEMDLWIGLTGVHPLGILGVTGGRKSRTMCSSK
jgi:hypothetical protein